MQGVNALEQHLVTALKLSLGATEISFAAMQENYAYRLRFRVSDLVRPLQHWTITIDPRALPELPLLVADAASEIYSERWAQSWAAIDA